MKKIFIYVMIMIFFSCTNQENNQKKYVLFPDSTNYEYITQKNGLLKVIRFFPETKNVSVIYFINPELKIKDSTMTCFDKTGKLKCRVIFRDSMKIRIFENFYVNGNLKSRISENDLDNKIIKQNYYEETGKLKTRKELILFQGKEYGNTKIFYNETGEINKDSTFYAELVTQKDTISLNDSLKIQFKVLGPNNGGYLSFFGSLKDFVDDVEYDNVKFNKGDYCYFKPQQIGKINVSIIFYVFCTPEDNSPFVKIYCKKDIFVIK